MKQTALSLKTIRDLRDCYDTHAEKFSSTRRKPRPEIVFVADAIKQQAQTKGRSLTVVELGCGDGRLLDQFMDSAHSSLHSYSGVDISGQLLAIAKARKIKGIQKIKRIHTDMITFLKQQKSESIDVIVTLASFQHLADAPTREQFVQEVYRVLDYEGQWISVDRAWSVWMVRKYFPIILSSLWKSISSLGWRSWNTLLLPFSSNGTTHLRLYHIFTSREWKKLLYKYRLQGVHYHASALPTQRRFFQSRNNCRIITKSIYKAS